MEQKGLMPEAARKLEQEKKTRALLEFLRKHAEFMRKIEQGTKA